MKGIKRKTKARAVAVWAAAVEATATEATAAHATAAHAMAARAVAAHATAAHAMAEGAAAVGGPMRVAANGASADAKEMRIGAKGTRIIVDGALPKSLGLSRSELKAAAMFFAEQSSARLLQEASKEKRSSAGNRRLAENASSALPSCATTPFREVTIILQDDEASDAVHRAIMGVAGATDVITQRYEAIPPEPSGVYGELYVNCDQALRAAPKRRGWSAAKELLLYVAHGMDHLSGADDHSPADYARMRRRELAWLRAADRRVAGKKSERRVAGKKSERRVAGQKAERRVAGKKNVRCAARHAQRKSTR